MINQKKTLYTDQSTRVHVDDFEDFYQLSYRVRAKEKRAKEKHAEFNDSTNKARRPITKPSFRTEEFK